MKRHPLDTSDLATAGDVIRLTDGKDRYYAGDADDHILAGGGSDSVRGGGGDDVIRGQAGDDTIRGERGADTLDGGKGSDTIAGGGGDDNVSGGDGTDFLYGEAGSDVVYGGEGGDVLDLGYDGTNEPTFADGDADTVLYKGVEDSTPDRFDRVYHFASGEDRVDLSAIDANATTPDSNEAFTFIGTAAFSGTPGELRVDELPGQGSALYGDVDGDGLADMKIYVETNNGPLLVVTDIAL